MNNEWLLSSVLQSLGFLDHIRNPFGKVSLPCHTPPPFHLKIHKDINLNSCYLGRVGRPLLTQHTLRNEGNVFSQSCCSGKALKWGPKSKMGKKNQLSESQEGPSQTIIATGTLWFWEAGKLCGGHILALSGNKPTVRCNSIPGVSQDTGMERPLASEAFCQGEKAKVPHTHRASVQMNFCSWKGNRVCVYRTNTTAPPSRLCSVLPTLCSREALPAMVKGPEGCDSNSFGVSPHKAKGFFAGQPQDRWAGCKPWEHRKGTPYLPPRKATF